MIYRIELEAVAPVYPTEDPDRVAEAITNLFPTADIESAPGEVHGVAHAIDTFSDRLTEQRILDTARTQLRDGIEGQTVSFALKKQPAYAGVVNFALEDPAELGDIHVRIDVAQPTPARFADELTAPPSD